MNFRTTKNSRRSSDNEELIGQQHRAVMLGARPWMSLNGPNREHLRELFAFWSVRGSQGRLDGGVGGRSARRSQRAREGSNGVGRVEWRGGSVVRMAMAIEAGSPRGCGCPGRRRCGEQDRGCFTISDVGSWVLWCFFPAELPWTRDAASCALEPCHSCAHPCTGVCSHLCCVRRLLVTNNVAERSNVTVPASPSVTSVL